MINERFPSTHLFFIIFFTGFIAICYAKTQSKKHSFFENTGECFHYNDRHKGFGKNKIVS